jgi:hypothetical protein
LVARHSAYPTPLRPVAVRRLGFAAVLQKRIADQEIDKRFD